MLRFGRRAAAVFVLFGLAVPVLWSGTSVAGGESGSGALTPDDIDIDGDGRADLVLGSSDLSFGGRRYMLFGDGSRQGLPAPGVRFDLSGPSVGCDVNGDGFSDVVVGVPSGFVRGVMAGGVVVLFGSESGLSRQRSLRITQATAGVPGRPEEADAFGGGGMRAYGP
jgi:hypothetical protein